MSVDELLRELNEPGYPHVLDVRWRLGGPPGRELYAAGHVIGAVFTDLDADLAAPPRTGPVAEAGSAAVVGSAAGAAAGGGGRHPLPSAAAFQASMRRLGVDSGRPVVVYDDADATAAARAWWLLRYFGHPSVRVLDGGFRAWLAASLTYETGEPREAPPAGGFTASPGHLPLLDAAAARDLARRGLLLDARAGERYRGEAEPADPVAGHVPGAVSAPTAQNVTADGAFRPPAELAARFAALGAAGGVEVGAYCGSGVTAAHEVLALSLAGIPAALYAGSWSDWITDPARPVATGAEP
ncbi:MAG TPA: sulfurtransferase [Trebonia sp.]|nr:sulfurtransferase [Trebonia sp.]